MRRPSIRLDEMRRQGFEPVERRHIADELRCQLLVLDNGFGDAGLQRVLKKPAPRAQARTLQIDNGNARRRSS